MPQSPVSPSPLAVAASGSALPCAVCVWSPVQESAKRTLLVGLAMGLAFDQARTCELREVTSSSGRWSAQRAALFMPTAVPWSKVGGSPPVGLRSPSDPPKAFGVLSAGSFTSEHPPPQSALGQ